MAYARPGIINLDFKDVSSMARDMRDNDWLRNSIDIAGKTLSERDRTILYNRALAEQEGQPIPTEKTSFELMGKGYEAIKSGLSKAASKVKDAAETIVPTDMTFDGTGFVDELLGKPKLKAPFYNYEDNQTSDQKQSVEEKPIEQPVEQPIVEQSSVMVYPSSDKNAPLKAPFYTFNPERSREDMTLPKDNSQVKPVEKTTVLNAPKAEEQAVVEKETTTTTNAKRTPNQLWSEMYRLSPERAKFDWDRVAPKGSGAAGTVQARLDHDRGINLQIADLTTKLISDMKANNWTSSSPEYIAAYNDIIKLNASKYNPDNKTDVDKYIDRELAGQRVTTQQERNAMAKEKQLNDKEMEAIKLSYNTSTDTLGKAKDVAVQMGKVYGLLNAGINKNPASIEAAAKILIQSFDNSAVLGNEIGMLTDQSAFGYVNSLYNRLMSGTRYTKEDVLKLYNIAAAIGTQTNDYIGNVASNANSIYESLQGKPSDTIPLLFSNYRVKIQPLDKEKLDQMDETLTSRIGESVGLGSKKSDEETIVVPTPKAKGSSPKQGVSKKEEKAPDNFNLEDF